MERDPQDKVIVVTGGARGIGYAITDHFLKNGAKTLIVLDIIETVGTEAVKKLNNKYGEDKAIFIKCDVTKDLDKISEEILGKYQVDVLINNAGVLDEYSIRTTMEINCMAVMEWSMKFWEHMRTDKGGRGGTIYNISSLYGFQYDPWSVYYKASKHAVLGFSRTLGHPYNYDRSGVRVITLCPGFTDTTILTGKIWDYQQEYFQKYWQAEVILQTPDTVGEAAVEIFAVADSGSVWVKENNEPIKLAPVLC